MEAVAEKFGQEKPGIEHVRGFCRVLVRGKAKYAYALPITEPNQTKPNQNRTPVVQAYSRAHQNIHRAIKERAAINVRSSVLRSSRHVLRRLLDGGQHSTISVQPFMPTYSVLPSQ